MTFYNTTPGMMRVVCNGCRKAELHQTPENKGVNTLDFMRAAGWTIGSSLCPGCQDGYGKAEAAGMVSFRKDAWDNVIEISPGVWAEAPPPAPVKRRRKIRKLV